MHTFKVFFELSFMHLLCVLAFWTPATVNAQSLTATPQTNNQTELREFIAETNTRLDVLSRGTDKPEFSELRRIRTELTRRVPQAQSEIEQSQIAVSGQRDEESATQEKARQAEFEIRRLEAEERRYDHNKTRLETVQSKLARHSDSSDDGPNSTVTVSPDNRDIDYNYLKDEAKYLESEIEYYESLSLDPNQSIVFFQRQLTAATSKLESIRADITTSQAILHSQNLDLIELRDIQSRVDDLINTLLIPETAQNEFKSRIALVFAGLVFAVIFGFFVIAYIDQGVRRSIFSSQSGIQFLTLFSLVIAIILFGITGILEDKELAALLGGLSGYILGRVGGNDRVQDPAAAHLPANPAAPVTPPV